MSTSRDNIKAMLKAVRDEINVVRAQADKRIKTLEIRADTLEEWLAEETPRQEELAITGGVNPPPVTLGSFLRGVLADGRPRALPELTQMAVEKGLVGEAKKPGRNVHFALVGLSQHGYVKRNSESQLWEVTKQ